MIGLNMQQVDKMLYFMNVLLRPSASDTITANSTQPPVSIKSWNYDYKEVSQH